MYWKTDIDDIKLSWKVVVNMNNNLLFEKDLKNFLNVILAFIIIIKSNT